jgi:quercetin dioxygenase-like cupin family protein
MFTTVKAGMPKTLAPGAGDTHQLMTHTIVWKTTANDTNGHYAMFEMTDGAGGGAPVHSHPWEETFYILEGEIEILLGNRREVFGAGAVIHVPAEAFFREAGARLTTLPPDPIVMQELAEKYQLQFC